MLKSFIFCWLLIVSTNFGIADATAKNDLGIDLTTELRDNLNIDFANGRRILEDLNQLAQEALEKGLQGSDKVEVEGLQLQVQNLLERVNSLEKMMYRTEANLRELILRSLVHLDSERLLLGGVFIRTNSCPKLVCGAAEAGQGVSADLLMEEDLPPVLETAKVEKKVQQITKAKASQEKRESLKIIEAMLNERTLISYLNQVEMLYEDNDLENAKWLLENSLAKVPSDTEFAFKLVNKLGVRLGKAKRDKEALEVFAIAYNRFEANEKIAHVFATNMLIQYIKLHDKDGYCRTIGLITNKKVAKNLARYYTYYQCEVLRED